MRFEFHAYLPTRMIEERVNAGFRDSAGWMGAI
jgi:hypothetical protein